MASPACRRHRPRRALGELGDGLRRLVLHELAHVAADHAHADLLVEDLLQLLGQADVLHRHRLQLQAELGEFLGRRGRLQLLGELDLVGRQVQEGDAALRHRVADVLQHQAAQLAVQVFHGVAVSRVPEIAVWKSLRVG
jgi:hypothetical protein